jgi:hypothetical protein
LPPSNRPRGNPVNFPPTPPRESPCRPA